MSDAPRDQNFVPTALGESSTTPGLTLPFLIDEVTGRLLCDVGGGGSGTVTSVSVVSANGFAGTVATATTTPAITLTTTITGILKGNGTAISAVTIGSGLSYDGTTLSATGGGSGITIGTTTITSGTNTRILYNNSGVVGEYTLTGSGTVVAMATAPTFATSITGSYLTASEILITDGSKNIVSAAVATYPSLTELTYLKGVTSAIQTQINAKGVGTVTSVSFTGGLISVATATSTPAFTVAGTSGGIPYFSSASTWATSAALAANAIVIGGGAGVAPATTTTGTGVLTALGINVGSAGAFLPNNGAGTSLTGIPYSLTGTANQVTLSAATGNITFSVPNDFRLASASVGTNADSVPTLSSTSTLTNKTLTSPTLTTPSAFTTGGTITLAENTSIALDPAGSADGKYTGITVTGVAGYTQAFGDLVYLAVADSRWELADADASATSGPVALAMVVVAGTDGAACTLLLQGIIRADAKFPTMTIGATQFVGETAGAIQGSIPTGADNIIRTVGYALTADELYFNPSTDWQVTVA